MTEKKKRNFISPSPLSRLFNDFFNSEKSSGLILIASAIVSLIIANSGWGEWYHDLWHVKIGSLSISYWINDALMAVFFLLVGLEIERELYAGELSNIKNAMLPVSAALGGMLFPAAIHALFNAGTATASGYGIPMATDIAFALGVLSLAGRSVPLALKIFLTALAIIDDLGAIVIIAIFYSAQISFTYLLLAAGIFTILFLMGKRGITNLWIYLLGGIAMWYCMFRSGVHPTISGVLLAFSIPFGKDDKSSPSYRLQHFLHKPVAFFIVPLFALANTGIQLEKGFQNNLLSKNSMGIIFGLVLGKPLGILTFCWLSIKLKWGRMPAGVQWKHIAGAGLVAGIGFTMSIFITLLAFRQEAFVVESKIAVLTASLLAAVSGLIVLRSIHKRQSRAAR